MLASSPLENLKVWSDSYPSAPESSLWAIRSSRTSLIYSKHSKPSQSLLMPLSGCLQVLSQSMLVGYALIELVWYLYNQTSLGALSHIHRCQQPQEYRRLVWWTGVCNCSALSAPQETYQLERSLYSSLCISKMESYPPRNMCPIHVW